MSVPILANQDYNKNELQNARMQNLASDPSTPVEGQMYWNTVAKRFKIYNPTTASFRNDADDAATLNAQAGSYYLARANHTGTQLAATISDFDTQVRTSKVHQLALATASFDMNNQKIINLLAAVNPGDAVNLAQMQTMQTGLDTKQSARAASTATVGTYNNVGGTSGRGQLTACPNTIDGVTLAASDRVLVKDHSTGAANGVYVVTTLGSGANGVWDRATDFDQDAEVTSGAYMWVTEGTVNDNTGWQLTTNDPIVIGGASGTALVFAQFNGVGALIAGTGCLKTGNTLDVQAGATPGSGGPGGGLKANADDLVIDTGIVARKYIVQIGDGSTTSIVVTHNLGNQWAQVTVIENSGSFRQIVVETQMTSANTCTLVFTVAPTTNQYRVVVIG